MIKSSANTTGTKTPISILQEYMVKKRGLIPQYELVHSGCGSTKVWFKFQLCISNITVIGEGPSKKDAKHNTAEAMLLKLGVLRHAPSPIQEINTTERAPPKVTCSYNAIGSLNEFCLKTCLPAPQYIIMKEDGPPHKKEFTIKCIVSNEFEIATAFSKQDAKHQSAAKLLERLSAMSPGMTDALEDRNETIAKFSPEELTEIIEKFKASTSLMRQQKLSTNTLDLPFKDYHCVVEMGSKISIPYINPLADIVRGDDFESFEAQLEVNHDYFLQKLLQGLNLKSEFITMPPRRKSTQIVVALNIHYTIFLSFLGVGKTRSEAKKSASIDALRWFVCLYV